MQTFDPVKHSGANEARFRNYINLCLANKFRTMRSKRMKDALCRPANLSLDVRMDREDPFSVNVEYCHSHSAHLQNAEKISEKQADDGAFLRDFMDFVRRKDSKVMPTVEAILATRTHGEAADWLGITKSEFARMRTRIGHLGECFLSGEPVPKQRRPYKTRTARTNQFSASELAA